MYVSINKESFNQKNAFVQAFICHLDIIQSMPTPAQTQTTGPNRDISTSRTKKYKRCLSPKEFDQTTTTVKFTKRRVVASFPCDKRWLVYVWLLPHAAPRKIFRAYVGTTWHNTRTSQATEFGHHHFWLRRPCRYWHVDKWPGNELSLRPVLECETVPEICCLWGSNSTHIHAVIVCYCWSWKTTRHLACDLLVDEISVSIPPLAH